jgi:hypothetical protein
MTLYGAQGTIRAALVLGARALPGRVGEGGEMTEVRSGGHEP